MSLSPRERRALDRIESALAREDPSLESLLSNPSARGHRRVVRRVSCVLLASLLLGIFLMVSGVSAAADGVAYTGLVLIVVAPWAAVAFLLAWTARAAPLG